MHSKQTSVTLGPLKAAIKRRLKTTGETISQYLRRVVAVDLGEPVPEIREGNPRPAKAGKIGAKARWAKTKQTT